MTGTAYSRLRDTMALLLACGLAFGIMPAGVPARSATLQVALDGSGDFTDLQAAADAAAAGDTILVAAGRYDALHVRVTPEWTAEVALFLDVDDLTVVGAGRDQTIIGPATWYSPVGEYPKGIAGRGALSVRVRDLGIENLAQSIAWPAGAVVLQGCRLSGAGFGWYGLLTGAGTGVLSGCSFVSSEEDGFAVWLEGSTAFTIGDSQFTGSGSGVHAGGGAQGVQVSGCSFSGSVVAIALDGSSAGTVVDCTVAGAAVKSLSVTGGAQAVVDHLFIEGGDHGIHAGSGAQVTATSVVVGQTLVSAVTVDGDAAMSMHGSHLLPAAGWAVSRFTYPGAPAVLDFSNNYWGATDGTAIAALVHDGVDDPAVHCVVQYAPYAGAPLPAEATSWGKLKASFR